MAASTVTINRAPVLTLWAAVVAERLGHERAVALSLGRAVAGLNAQSKGRRLGIFDADETPERHGRPKAAGLDAGHSVELCGRRVSIRNTPTGIRALADDLPIEPEKVEAYLAAKLGDRLPEVTAAMRDLAESYPPDELAARAYGLYERFRPGVPSGAGGWGAKGVLDLALIRSLHRQEGAP